MPSVPGVLPFRQRNWYRNKIKSSIAEACAQNHFEAMGYNVEHLGVEHMMSNAALRGFNSSDRSKHLSSGAQSLIQRMPDFLMTRRREGEYDVLLIEAKFRNRAWLKNAGQCDGCQHENALHIFEGESLKCDPASKTKSCLHCNYRELIELGRPASSRAAKAGNVLFYLVARTVTIVDEEPSADRIFLNLAFKPRWWSRTRTADDFSARPEYRETADHPSFLHVEEHSIKPALDDIFSR